MALDAWLEGPELGPRQPIGLSGSQPALTPPPPPVYHTLGGVPHPRWGTHLDAAQLSKGGGRGGQLLQLLLEQPLA